MVEVVISSMLVAFLLVGAMSCLGAVVRGRRSGPYVDRLPESGATACSATDDRDTQYGLHR